MKTQDQSIRTLAVDIGGSGIKLIVLDKDGNPLTERVRVETPRPATTDAVIAAALKLAATQGDFDRVSVGFPGVVRNGVTKMAVNLHPDWVEFDLATTLSNHWGKPVRVANDADVQGFAVVSGHGVELVITLGTGFGSALFLDGKLVPNLEFGHHIFRHDKTYEEQLGRAALDKVGKEKWNERLEKAIAALENLFSYDNLYIGGGNAKKVALNLPSNAKIVSNESGLFGGVALWRD